MKRLAFFYTLLGSASIISAVDNAPEPDTWCMTYLSTYLVPVYNQASSLVMTNPAAESGKQPIAPSLKPAFVGNNSTQRTETGFDKSLPTSVVLRETSVASELSSDSRGSSTLGIEPSLAATESDGSITPPLIDEVVPSSTTDTNAIPTSSGLVEPARRSVIFQVSVTGNEKRNIHKRQATGGFVGNDKPKSCTFAATFILSEGKLFEGGAPIHYSGEIAQCQDGRLIGDDEYTSTISGSVAQETITLEETDPRVTSDVEDASTVDVTASNSEHSVTQPESINTLSLTSDSGASAITLISHSEPLTTDGGQPPSESEFTLFTSTTDGLENTASVSSTEADTTINEDTTAISDTISVDTTTTTTADTDTTAAGTTTADTTTSSGVPNPDCTSTSNPYTAPNGTTFFNVDVLRYIGANNFLSCVQACSEIEACVSSQFNVPASLCILLSRIDVETSQSIDGNDAAIKDSIIAGSTTATAETTNIDSTATSIMTADASTTASDVSNPDCSSVSNPYTANNGETFTVACNTIVGRDVLRVPDVYDYVSCLEVCSETEACVAFYYYKPGTECVLLSRVYDDTTQANQDCDLGLKDSAFPDTTTTTADAPIADITTSTIPSETPVPASCADLDTPVIVGDDVYDLACDTDMSYTPVGAVSGVTFFACLQACADRGDCNTVLFQKSNGFCALCSYGFGLIPDVRYDVATKQDKD
ncbi:hypothetical protein ACHAPY_010074 [Fusarium culmorum]